MSRIGRRGPYQRHTDESLKTEASKYATRGAFAKGAAVKASA
jgi:hypothetical protein